MFDDLNNKNGIGNSNQPKADDAREQNLSNFDKKPMPAEDIFADINKNEKPKVFQAKSVDNSSIKNANNQLAKKDNKKFLYIFTGLLSIILLLIAGFLIFNFLTNNSANQTANEQSPVNLQEKNLETETEQNTVGDDTELVVPDIVKQPLDSDQDGLTDEEEYIAGSSSSNVDTDGDGLFDREEVKVYLTDPTNPDTDGDGYLDGDEVKSGYNPKGPGKLYEIK